MRYRVDDLAARGRVSVDTIRFYQSRGLLPPPDREGRVAWYSDEHLTRLKRVRELKDKGLTLASIKLLLNGDLDAADEGLVALLSDPHPDETADSGRLLSLDELARSTGVSTALLRVIEREGLLVPQRIDGEARYTAADGDAVRAGLALLETGLPLGELLDLARRHDQAMREIATQAVEIFIRFVRDPIRATAPSDAEAGRRLVEAFRTMLPATTSLVGHHFRRMLLSEARARIESEGPVEEARTVGSDAGGRQ